jgi:hypothetical protein
VKKGRHRRYEEARALKRTDDGFDDLLAPRDEPCVECLGLPGEHKWWCQLADSAQASGDDSDPATLFPS